MIVQFRWGDPRMYGQAISCIIVDVEESEIVVRALYMDGPGRRMQYPKLLKLGKLLPVAETSDVFRIRRIDISAIFLR